MNEEWKDIKQLDGEYQISNLGRIRRSKAVIGTGSSRTYIGKLLKTEVCPQGYERFRVGRPRKNFRVHRLVADAFIPNPLRKPHVNHLNEIKSDNTVDNLEWSTVEENNTHSLTMVVQRFIMTLDSNKRYTPKELLEALPGRGRA